MSENQAAARRQLSRGDLLKEQGRLEDAIQCYQEEVAICPGNAELWYDLGTTLLALSRLPEAVQALRKAIALQPDFVNAYNNLGGALKKQGLYEDAVQCYETGLDICPGSARLWYNLGTTLLKLSRLSEAVTAFQQAIVLQPDFAGTYINLGYALKEQGLLADALQWYQEGVTICPDHAGLWYALGTTLRELPRPSEAAQALQQAIVCKPDYAEAYNNLGGVLLELQRPSEAVQALQQAIALKPDYAEAYTNLGDALLKLQRPSEAVQVLQQAIAFKPDLFGAYNNLGNALQSLGETEDAIAAYNRAIALNPADPGVYNNRAQAILLSGNLARGFAEYEWRNKGNDSRHSDEWCEEKMRWHGENFSGKRLLVHYEQGFGDTLQFCRYLPLVKARGGIVQFSAKQPLLRLFANFPGIDELIEHTAAAFAQAQFDLMVPLMSLPYIFGTTLRTIPASVPYLTVEQHSIDTWRNKMNCPGSHLRVGLAWAGNSANIPGQSRTCGLQAMYLLAGIPGTTFCSLQKGVAANEANTPPPGMRLIDLTDDIADFADTAALIMNLDLVISVDTAVAHLAGALAKPVWTLLPSAGEWRWLLARNDTPWYPTMRLFRQTAPGDWTGVMTAVAQELRTLLSATAK